MRRKKEEFETTTTIFFFFFLFDCNSASTNLFDELIASSSSFFSPRVSLLSFFSGAYYSEFANRKRLIGRERGPPTRFRHSEQKKRDLAAAMAPEYPAASYSVERMEKKKREEENPLLLLFL